MYVKRFSHKAIERLSISALKMIGIDAISMEKINARDDLKEIGSEYGGWVIPYNLLHGDSICYCVGCGEDISFDLGLIEAFGCEIHAFDPTPRAVEYVEQLTAGNPKYHFFPVGLWDKADVLRFYVPANPEHVSHSLLNLQGTESYIEVQVDRLTNIMENLGHKRIDLLKMDIEGAEYKVIDSFIEDGIDIKVVCVEFDEYANPLDKDYRERIKGAVRKLTSSGYSLVCAQGNGNYTFVRE